MTQEFVEDERDLHFDDCGIWYDEDCDCPVRWIGMEEDA